MALSDEEDTTHTMNFSDVVKELYPDALRRTYMVPPIHFNRMPYTRVVVPGTNQSALVLSHAPREPHSRDAVPGAQHPEQQHPDDVSPPSPPPLSPPQSMWPLNMLQTSSMPPPRVQESDFQDDRTQTQVLRNLQVLGDSLGETMFILSDLSFSTYLSSAITNLNTATKQLPLAPDHSQEEQPSPVTTPSEEDLTKQHPFAWYQSQEEVTEQLSFATDHRQREGTKQLPRAASPSQEEATKDPPRGPSHDQGEEVQSDVFAEATSPNQEEATRESRRSSNPNQEEASPLFPPGDFSVLVVHRPYGLLLGEVKSVGRYLSAFTATQDEADAAIAKRVKRALRQLTKSQRMATHVTNSVAPDLTVRTTIFLPYVSREQLQRVLKSDPELEREAREILGADNAAHAASLCCCSDQLSDPATWWQVPESTLDRLKSWWRARMSPTDNPLDDERYLDVVASFVGPATSVTVFSATSTRVDVRTLAKALSELGWRLSRLVLTPGQMELMHRSPTRVYITGPPGTGKTLMLVLQALVWLRRGKTVHLVSANGIVSRPATALIKHQLELTLAADPGSASAPPAGKVVEHVYDFTDGQSQVDRAVADLLEASVTHKGELHVVMDEVLFDTSSAVGQGYQKLVTELTTRVPALRLWAAGLYHTPVPPNLLLETLTVPLRCAPAVLREVQPGVDHFASKVLGYSDMGVPSPADGPEVLRLQHQGEGHSGLWPVQCEQCGREVAAVLKQLGVNDPGSSITYRDIFVLARNLDLEDDFPNSINFPNNVAKTMSPADTTMTSPADSTVSPTISIMTSPADSMMSPIRSVIASPTDSTMSTADRVMMTPEDITVSTAGSVITSPTDSSVSTTDIIMTSPADRTMSSTDNTKAASTNSIIKLPDDSSNISFTDSATTLLASCTTSPADSIKMPSSGSTMMSTTDSNMTSPQGGALTSSFDSRTASKTPSPYATHSPVTTTATTPSLVTTTTSQISTTPAVTINSPVSILMSPASTTVLPASSTRSQSYTTEWSSGTNIPPTKAKGLVHGLRQAGIPVCVLGKKGKLRNNALWERTLVDVAVARNDVVTAAHSKYVQGLERKVVVWLRSCHQADQAIEAEERLLAVSRATVQLIVVDVPSKTPDTKRQQCILM